MANQQTKRPSRKERERQRHRREILDAAERIFAHKGYHLATVEEIAEEAEFSVGALYNFFRSKQEMYTQVIEEITHDFWEAFNREVLTKDDPVKAISALIELRLTHFEHHRGFVRVFFETTPGSRLDPSRGLPRHCAELYDQYIESVREIFQRGIREGLFDDVDPFYLTLSLEGTINTFVAYWTRREPSEPLAERVRKIKEAFLGRLRTNHHLSAGPSAKQSVR